MSKIVLTRGIPASGKSTWAKRWVAEDPENRIRLNRDDLRKMLGGGPTPFDFTREQIITKMQHATARDALLQGKDVVVDDTNLRAKYVREWYGVGPVEFNDFEIDLEEAYNLDSCREDSVGYDVIKSFHDRFVKPNGGKLPAPPEPVAAKPLGEPYVADVNLPEAAIVDTDGTVARMNGRGPYDGHMVHTDLPIDNVITLVRRLAQYGVKIIGVSGRDEKYRDVTEEWWRANGIPFHEFYLRPAGDRRNDSVVKLEIFDQHIRNRFNVTAVIDDRLRVVRMWHALGLTVYRVGDPDAAF